jgi:RNA polymerase sigma-70 factor, ECF subfamily
MDGEALAATIKGAQRGDPASFDRLVDHYASRVFGLLYRLTGSRADAEDLMQEVFLRVVRMIGAYHHDGRFDAWLFRIAANLCRDRVRRAKRAPKIVALDAPSQGPDEASSGPRSFGDITASTPSPDAGLIRTEELDALGKALEQLPEAERTVIMLRHFSQMSFKEIAEAMDTPLGTALARAHRALGRLREIMSAEPDAGAKFDLSASKPESAGVSPAA